MPAKRYKKGYEWTSRRRWRGIPLVHVAFGRDDAGKRLVARGIVAVGQFAIGLLTLAQFGVGALGIGQFIFGESVIAHFALGGHTGIGQFAFGGRLAIGQFAAGRVEQAQFGFTLSPEVNMILSYTMTILLFAILGQAFSTARKREDAARAPAPGALADFLLVEAANADTGRPADETTGARPAAAADDLLPPGTRLGPYRIVQTLGRGGMGVVYKAEHTLLDRVVAVKVLPRALARDPQFLARFKREAQALAKLRHPHIVAVYDMGREGDVTYFTMEYVDGTNLRALLRTRALRPEQALALVPKLCDALQYAHSQGIVHRDIKPENVLLGRDGEPRIADFGLARLVGGPDVSAITETGTALGTRDYMAPEQRSGAPDVDHRADIYSLGVVLYEMLTGELPIGRFQPPAKKVEVDVRIDEVVLKALEADRERRYARADEMGTDVRNISSAAPVKLSPGLDAQ